MEGGTLDIGLIGLGVMGENLVLNIEGKGFTVGVYNRTSGKTEAFMEDRAEGKNIHGFYSLSDFCKSLSEPRKVMILVKAGDPVDMVIEGLLPFLSQNDIIMDCGNSYYEDTNRRAGLLNKKGFHFMGIGVSGGEEGALKGPSIMPGGSEAAWAEVKDILLLIAATFNDEPCCGYLGPEGAGHFVKMVHNGIEYADMALIAEGYDILRRSGIDAKTCSDIFRVWGQRGHLDSYLMDITADILEKDDPYTENALVDMILDEAKQKGTGLWTSLSALKMLVPAPTIIEAVNLRIISNFSDERYQAWKNYPCSANADMPIYKGHTEIDDLKEIIHDALLGGKICAYAQGLSILKSASEQFGWDLDMSMIAGLWRNGCIIRASLLEDIRNAYSKERSPANLLLSPEFIPVMDRVYLSWKEAIKFALNGNIAVPALSSAFNYFNLYRSRHLPMNLVQAQRDYFGAHTYRRIDREGDFHTEWF